MMVPRNPKKILVVALRRIGDVLLTTPLVRSLRRAWPHARIDMLVFADTAGILEGNPDIDHVIAMPVGAGAGVALAVRLARRYDLAISTQSGDRPIIFAALAGRASIAPVADGGIMGAVKRALLSEAVPIAAGVHRVEEMLRLADAIGIARVPEVVCPAEAPPLAAGAPYAVMHPAPMFQYKRWTDAGWREIAQGLARRGLEVVVTGGPAVAERAYLDTMLDGVTNVRRVDGALAWPQLAMMVKNARVFVGPDTSVTHLAAASGAPTVALYGPTDPRIWGPWPAQGLAQPWEAAGTIQRRSNVWLVQNPQPCLPCQQEGCDRHVMSYSRCMDELSARQVLAAIDQALAGSVADSGARA